MARILGAWRGSGAAILGGSCEVGSCHLTAVLEITTLEDTEPRLGGKEEAGAWRGGQGRVDLRETLFRHGAQGRLVMKRTRHTPNYRRALLLDPS